MKPAEFNDLIRMMLIDPLQWWYFALGSAIFGVWPQTPRLEGTPFSSHPDLEPRCTKESLCLCYSC